MKKGMKFAEVPIMNKQTQGQRKAERRQQAFENQRFNFDVLQGDQNGNEDKTILVCISTDDTAAKEESEMKVLDHDDDSDDDECFSNFSKIKIGERTHSPRHSSDVAGPSVDIATSQQIGGTETCERTHSPGHSSDVARPMSVDIAAVNTEKDFPSLENLKNIANSTAANRKARQYRFSDVERPRGIEEHQMTVGSDAGWAPITDEAANESAFTHNNFQKDSMPKPSSEERAETVIEV